MPTRAVWDLHVLPEPEGQGNKSHAAPGGVRGTTILKPTMACIPY